MGKYREMRERLKREEEERSRLARERREKGWRESSVEKQTSGKSKSIGGFGCECLCELLLSLIVLLLTIFFIFIGSA
ncbi:MAG: hypothetical protein ACFE9M_09525 [Promethearchaeota archaeon]